MRGTPIESGAKALVFLAADRPVHVVLPGAPRRQCPAARRARRPHPEVRDAEAAPALTGCVPGAVPPFGNLFGLPRAVDEALAEQGEIAFSAGSNTVSIVMRGDEFLLSRGPRARAHAACPARPSDPRRDRATLGRGAAVVARHEEGRRRTPVDFQYTPEQEPSTGPPAVARRQSAAGSLRRRSHRRARRARPRDVRAARRVAADDVQGGLGGHLLAARSTAGAAPR